MKGKYFKNIWKLSNGGNKKKKKKSQIEMILVQIKRTNHVTTVSRKDNINDERR